MLTHIEIKNYVLIEHLEIDFRNGLSVITGETGAGKSIILGALGLVMGQRADAKCIRAGAQKCVIEAMFDIVDYNLQPLFEQIDVDYVDQTMLRREVSVGGKSRAFINDTPVNLMQLRTVATLLIDIHSQHEMLLMHENAFQMHVLDIVAGTQSLLATYRAAYVDYGATRHRLDELRTAAERERADRDFAEFQWKQLDEAHLQSGEQEQLEAELDMMNHSEEVREAAVTVGRLLTADESGACAQLRESVAMLRRVAPMWVQATDLAERLDSVRLETVDVVEEIEHRLSNLNFDIGRKAVVEDRLNLIYTLQQKHRVSTVEALIGIYNDFAEQLTRIDSYDNAIVEQEKLLEHQTAVLREASNRLSEQRHKAIGTLACEVSRQVAALGIPAARFEIRQEPLNDFAPNGCDRITFLFSANKSVPPQPVTAVASGGELSRLMLVIKALVAGKMQLPTIIFDEIDTGISGETAQRVGAVMQQMAHDMQVLVITHLPQIAAKGATHYKVFKRDTMTGTETCIEQLSRSRRIAEIAEMLSGKNPSQAAMHNAEELLEK